MPGELLEGFGSELLARTLAAQLFEEVICQRGEVLHALAQGRDFDGKDGQPVKQVEAKVPLGGSAFQRLVGGCDQAHIDARDGVVADALQLARLQKPKHFGLHGDRHLANLVQQQGPAVGHFDPAEARLHGSGKRSAGVAKQLRFEQRLGNCGAVQHDEGPGRPQAEPMQGPRHQLLAGTGLALDQDSGGARRDQPHQPGHLAHGPAFADQLGQQEIRGRDCLPRGQTSVRHAAIGRDPVGRRGLP